MTTLRSILCIQVLMYKKLSSFVVSSTFKYTDFLKNEEQENMYILPSASTYTHNTILVFYASIQKLKGDHVNSKSFIIDPFTCKKHAFYEKWIFNTNRISNCLEKASVGKGTKL